MEKTHQWRPFWGDLHGQSEETVGTNTVDDYFAFARNMAGAQFSCHQGNDFQVTKDTWSTIRAATRKYNEPGRFVTFLGVEMVRRDGYGRGQERHVSRRRWPSAPYQPLATGGLDRSGKDRYPLDALYGALEGSRDVTLVPHIGGRRRAWTITTQNLSASWKYILPGDDSNGLWRKPWKRVGAWASRQGAMGTRADRERATRERLFSESMAVTPAFMQQNSRARASGSDPGQARLCDDGQENSSLLFGWRTFYGRGIRIHRSTSVQSPRNGRMRDRID